MVMLPLLDPVFCQPNAHPRTIQIAGPGGVLIATNRSPSKTRGTTAERGRICQRPTAGPSIDLNKDNLIRGHCDRAGVRRRRSAVAAFVRHGLLGRGQRWPQRKCEERAQGE